ncbi:MAG: hypothetical protein MJ215_01915 [Spirochaetia bacterium]|nr:hypothetical protein [Spirochaetia bacterium]
MLLFYATLDINSKMTPDAFISMVLEWNRSHKYSDNVIPGIEWHGERNIRYGNERLSLTFQEYSRKNIIAVRYEKIFENEVIWNSDYIMNFNEMHLAVQLYRSYQDDIPVMDREFSTPYFISMLIENGYVDDDGILPVLRDPIIVDDDNVQMLADLMNGKVSFHLPVIYISRTADDLCPVAADWLASRLKGVAHVLLESDMRLHDRLEELCGSENVQHGAVDIYYPNQSRIHLHLQYQRHDGEASVLQDKIEKEMIRYSISQKIDALYTWQGVNNAVLLEKLDGQREADELIQSFDDEVQKLKQQILDLTRANESLNYENYGLRNKLNASDSVPMLFFGSEEEFFQGEIRDIVLSGLDDRLKATPEGSRRYHVLKDILSANRYEHILDERQKMVRKCLNAYDGLSGTMRQDLKDLGMEITDEGRHYKIRYFGDPRYWVTMAKTPSDSQRGDMNLIAKIIKTML